MAGLRGDITSTYAPTTWTSMTDNVSLVKLSATSSEFRQVEQKVKCTLHVSLKSVERVENPYLWGCYLLKKAEYKARGISANEQDLFHCTAASNIESITADNLDWRRCSRTKFGQGMSFSPDAEYANKYATFTIGSQRAMIVTKVLVGQTIGGSQAMILPPNSYDTTTGNRSQVYVKYYDHEFYPSYVAYYNYQTSYRPPRRSYYDYYDFDSYSDSD